MSAASCKWTATICGSCFTGPSSASASDFPAENSTRDPVTHQEAVDTLATERYLLDDMAGTDREAFEEHFFSCEACAADLRTASAMLQGAQEGFAGQATSNVVTMPVKRAAVSAPAWYRSAAPAWAAAAVLALVAGYQSLVVVPSLRLGTASLAVVPVTLRSVCRGGE